MAARRDEGWPRRGAAILAGLLGVAAVFGLDQTATGIAYAYQPPFTRFAPGALLFWLAHAVLLVPAGALLAFGLSPGLGEPLARGWRGLQGPAGPSTARLAAAVGLLAGAVALLGGRLVLRGQPLTDEELVLRFAGQILASGSLAVPVPEPELGFVKLFTYTTPDGRITSMDWPGGHLLYGLSVATGTGPLVFAALAGLGAGSVAAVAALRHGRALGLLGGGLMLLSPMGLTLSFTGHPHLASRSLLGVTLLLLLLAERRERLAPWAVAGFVWLLAFSCRPPEVAALTLPLALSYGARALARRGPGGAASRPALGLLLGAAPVVLAIVAYHEALSGTPWFLRMLPGHLGNGITLPDPWWSTRFGANLSYNLLLLSVWALGPLGVLLAVVGAPHDRLTRLLAAGLGLHLLLALAHENAGIHAVGPIHYSEALVVVILLAVAGLERLARLARAHGIPRRSGALAVLGILVVGLGLFDIHTVGQLRRQATIQLEVKRRVAAAVEAHGAERAFVVTPTFDHVWAQTASFRRVGTWVFHWPRPDPRGGDRIRYVVLDPPMEGVPLERLREADPSRAVFRIRRDPMAPHGFRVVPVDSAGASAGRRPGG